MLRFVFSIQMIEVAEELVEAVHGGQELVAITKMILAELPCCVALRFQQFSDGRIFGGQAFLCRGQTYFEQPGTQGTLPGDKGGAASGARLLAVIVGEDRALVGNAVDVGRAVAHHAAIVGADVPVADVIAHDDKDVGFLLLRRRGCDHCGSKRREQREADVPAPVHRRSPDEGIVRKAYAGQRV
jgi:hypothetical protein